MDLAKLRKDLERVHPGGSCTIDARQLKELLTMAEAKVDPWRMFRRPAFASWEEWEKWAAHVHERLTALEEAVAPQAEAEQLTGAEFLAEAKERLGGGITWTDEILNESRRQVQVAEIDTEALRQRLRGAIEAEGLKPGHISVAPAESHVWTDITIEARKP